jgi:hypothetical protein
MHDSPVKPRRLRAKVLAGFAALCALGVLAYAAVMASVSVQKNFFSTGSVSVNLNGGNAILTGGELLLNPGETLEETFYIENTSTCEVYYRLYFTNVEGYLADVLQVSILDGEDTLFSGTATQLTRSSAAAGLTALAEGESRTLTMVVHCPLNNSNTANGQQLAFDLAADVVQASNNPNRLFS